jgi:methylenetetrahydrofolate dehydrogenase (NADP+)/methenyltetrahydrofolate cyclohydrolase
LLALIKNLNERDEVDGILVQLPLPAQIDEEAVLTSIDPEKDVDGFHPLNIGRLVRGETALAPCTPAGIVELLDRSGCEIAGHHACIVGRSHIVGRPLAALLLQRDATITICHSRTKDLAAITSLADILIVAVGRINLIRGVNIKAGATVIDVGMNSLADVAAVDDLFAASEAAERRKLIERKGSTLVGDVNRREVEAVAGRLTPVPGGVGPMTIAMLMKNTLTAATRRRNL